MSDERMPPGISTEAWNATPLAVRELVLQLLQQSEQLQQRIAALEERLNQNSRNSSKPPSSDSPATPREAYPKRTPSGRKVGGQPGHVGRTRPLKPLDQVQDVIELCPTSCGACGAWLLGEDPQPQRHQVTELPRIAPHVTEYRRHTVTCLVCGTETQARVPPICRPVILDRVSKPQPVT